MRAGWLALVLAAGCEPAICSPEELFEGATCNAEHESCGGIDGPACAIGLQCVSTMLCAIGPCPGTCLAPCSSEEDCDDSEQCTAPEGWQDERYCTSDGDL